MSARVSLMSNPYCEILDIQTPAVKAVRDHPQANTYALMIVALLENSNVDVLPTR